MKIVEGVRDQMWVGWVEREVGWREREGRRREVGTFTPIPGETDQPVGVFWGGRSGATG